MARTLVLDTITEPSNSGTANITLSSDTTTTMPKVDINSGAIDATTLGAAVPSSVAATTLSATGTATLTTVDINGGAIDGTTLGVATPSSVAATTLSASGNATVGGTFGVTGVSTVGALTATSLNGVTIGTDWQSDIQVAGDNIVAGSNAMSGIESGSTKNIALGYQALHGTLSNANNNIAIGNTAMAFATTGSNQTVSGSNNIALGVQNFPFLTTGYVNIVIGKDAGRAITDGTYRICIGSWADVTGNYGIAIGKSISAGADTCVIGRSSNQISCDFSSTGTWSQSSDIRKKTDIQSCDLGLSFIDALRTTTFKFKPAEEHPEEWGHFDDELDDDGELVKRTYAEMDTVTKRYGMIAQEVKEVITNSGAEDYFPGWSEDENGCQMLGYGDFVLPLIKAVQELSAKVKALESE